MTTTKYLREVCISYNRTNHNVYDGKVSDSDGVANYLREYVYQPELLEYTESFVAIFLNRANQVIGYHVLSQGGMTGTVADIRVLFSVALLCGATGMIISHNHPSGNLKPSDADNHLTKRILDAGKILDVTVLDHVIVTREGHYSYANEGKM